MPQGTVAVYSWNMQDGGGARFDNVQVKQLSKPYLVEHFNDGDVAAWSDVTNPYADRWMVVDQGTLSAPSYWSVSGGILSENSNIYGPHWASESEREGTYLYYEDEAGDCYQWKDYKLRST